MDWHKHFIYEGATGNLIRKPLAYAGTRSMQEFNRWNSRNGGKVAGTPRTDGKGRRHMVYVRLNGVRLGAHRIIWEMFHGPILPGMVIDHIDGNPWNNRLDNLRMCTQRENCYNQALRSCNPHKLKGVVAYKDKYRATIKVDGRMKALGVFPTKGLAAVARAKAAIRYHGQFARLT